MSISAHAILSCDYVNICCTAYYVSGTALVYTVPIKIKI